MLRQRGIDRLPEEAAYLADRYGDSDHPEAATFAARVQAAADGRPVNEFEEVIERGLDRLPHVGLWVDPSGFDPQGVVDLLLDRRAETAWMVDVGSIRRPLNGCNSQLCGQTALDQLLHRLAARPSPAEPTP